MFRSLPALASVTVMFSDPLTLTIVWEEAIWPEP